MMSAIISTINICLKSSNEGFKVIDFVETILLSYDAQDIK